MRDYPFFKLYPADVLLEIVGMSNDEIGAYFLAAIGAWQRNDFEAMPEWMQRNVAECEELSQVRKEAAAKRWEKRSANVVQSDVNAMQIDANAMQIDANRCREEENREEKKEEKRRGVFTPPTIEEVSDYINAQSYPVDANKWHDHYTAKGWLVGKTKMKDWKAAVRSWLPDGYTKPQKKEGSNFVIGRLPL